MDLSVEFLGLRFENPLMPASGPLTGDFDKMKYISQLGVGGMVTKTISVKGARVSRPCIYGSNSFALNNELWSEYPLEVWIKDILPRLKLDLNMPLIVSAGYTKEDMEYLIPRLDSFADAFEISTHYVGKDLSNIAKTVATIRKSTRKPILMKMSPHVSDPVEFAKMVKDNGGDGVVAINSVGPAMQIDIKKKSTVIGDKSGFAWMSGPYIKPLALAFVHNIKQNVPDFAVIGVGGIKTASDVVEFILAGADGVQMLSSALLYGKDLYQKIVDELPKVLQENGFASMKEVKNTKLSMLETSFEPEVPRVDKDKCIMCGLCEKVCPYFAIKIKDEVLVDEKKCFGCSLCTCRCPKQALVL